VRGCELDANVSVGTNGGLLFNTNEIFSPQITNENER